ncbi:MAG TPA: GGDEF domain-containing protein [Gemmatimonadaceae bacterium]|nr:GGDEF domain-containing protein [Gemmatimonadaceae bacterium]
MNTIALAVPVVVGLELCASIGLSWLCWRLARRRNLLALRDISRAFMALGFAAALPLLELYGVTGVALTALEFCRSLSVWLYLGFMTLGAAQLAANDFVTDSVRRDAVLGAGMAALLTTGISLIAIGDLMQQDMIRNALRAGGTGVTCLIIARIVGRAATPPKMVLGASVVRVALVLVALLAALRAGIAMLHGFRAITDTVQWQPLLTVEFLAHCALCLGLLIWILDRDWALADASRNQAELRAGSDALTGLPNRTIVMDRLDVAVEAAKRSGTQVGVLYIDLDGFKQVNDRHGHLAGDDVLREVGSRLQQLLRASDTVGRIGGDEFVAISPFLRQGSDLDVVVAKVREALKHVVVHGGVNIDVDGSVGAALFPRDGDTPTALLAVSDSALYRDKGARRHVRRTTPHHSALTA